jgi:hypothetical protein
MSSYALVRNIETSGPKRKVAWGGRSFRARAAVVLNRIDDIPGTPQ